MKKLSIVIILFLFMIVGHAQDYTIEIKDIKTFYAGIYNELKLSISDVDYENIFINVSDGEIRKNSNGFLYKNNNTGYIDFIIGYKENDDNITIDTVIYRVIQLPEAIATINGINKKVITKEDLLNAEKIDITFPSMLYDLEYKIINHSLEGTVNTFHYYKRSNSKNISPEQKDIIQKWFSIGNRLWFSEIKVLIQNSDSLVVAAKDIFFKIEGPKAAIHVYNKCLGVDYFHSGWCDISKADLLLIDSLDVDCEEDYRIDDLDREDRIDHNYKIISYKVLCHYDKKSSLVTKKISVKGNGVTREVKKLIKKAKCGESIRFYDIEGLNKKGEKVKIGVLTIRLLK